MPPATALSPISDFAAGSRSLTDDGPIDGRRAGALISTEPGEAVHYALFTIQERGTLFVSPGDKVYQGIILGETARLNDLEVNPIKETKPTNVRAMGEDDAMLLIPPRKMSLEQAIAQVEDDEPVAVTPFAIPQRKQFLDPNQRKRNERKTDAEAAAQPVISSSAWSGTA